MNWLTLPFVVQDTEYYRSDKELIRHFSFQTVL